MMEIKSFCFFCFQFYMHSNLGRVIAEVLKEFSDHPPQFRGPLTSQPQ